MRKCRRRGGPGDRRDQGLRGIDHVGINVPDLDEADTFLVGVLGSVHVYTLGAKRAKDDWMHEHLGVYPRTVLSEIRSYRLGNGANLEVFHYEPADGRAPPSRKDDLDAAVAHLHSHGLETMGAPTASRQAAEGQRWVYFRAPWGLQLELVSNPDGKAYETDAAVRLWHPKEPGR